MRSLLSKSFISSAILLAAFAAWAGANYDYLTATQYMAIGTVSPNSKAALDVSSTTKGILFPRMTTTQKNAIATPPDGLMVFDTTVGAPYYYASSAWNQLLSTSTVVLQFADTTTPATPSSGTVKMYSKSGVVMALNSGGVELGLQRGSQAFTSSGTFTVPAGVQQITVCGCGGGGGGAAGGSTGSSRGGGGGEGSPLRCYKSASTPAGTHTVTLGALGAHGTTVGAGNGTNGTDGGDTTFGSLFTFYGGEKGFGTNQSGETATVQQGGHKLAGGGQGGWGSGTATGQFAARAGQSGIFAGGTGGTNTGSNGGGGGGGSGGNGVGSNGTNGSNTTATAATAAAVNTCAGGGGGGGGQSNGGNGADGGSGYVIVYW